MDRSSNVVEGNSDEQRYLNKEIQDDVVPANSTGGNKLPTISNQSVRTLGTECSATCHSLSISGSSYVRQKDVSVAEAANEFVQKQEQDGGTVIGASSGSGSVFRNTSSSKVSNQTLDRSYPSTTTPTSSRNLHLTRRAAQGGNFGSSGGSGGGSGTSATGLGKAMMRQLFNTITSPSKRDLYSEEKDGSLDQEIHTGAGAGIAMGLFGNQHSSGTEHALESENSIDLSCIDSSAHNINGPRMTTAKHNISDLSTPDLPASASSDGKVDATSLSAQNHADSPDERTLNVKEKTAKTNKDEEYPFRSELSQQDEQCARQNNVEPEKGDNSKPSSEYQNNAVEASSKALSSDQIPECSIATVEDQVSGLENNELKASASADRNTISPKTSTLKKEVQLPTSPTSEEASVATRVKTEVYDMFASSPYVAFENVVQRLNKFPKFDFHRELELGDELGRGQFGVVREIIHVRLLPRSFHGSWPSMRFDNHKQEDEEEKPTTQERRNRFHNRDSSMASCFTDDEEEGRIFIQQHCVRSATGTARYAIKMINPSNIMSSKDKLYHSIRDLAIEAHFLASLEHPNIIKLRGLSVQEMGGEQFFVVLDKLYETLEHCIYQTWYERDRHLYKQSKSVVAKMIKKGKKSKKSIQVQRNEAWLERLTHGLDLLSALVYLHDRGMMHRDLKPDNMGFDVRGDIRLFDFGLAKQLHSNKAVVDKRKLYMCHPSQREDLKHQKLRDTTPSRDVRVQFRTSILARDDEKAKTNTDADDIDSSSPLFLHTGCAGTKRYMAPENFLCNKYNESADIYSFGLILWEMLQLTKPYIEFHDPSTFEALVIHRGIRPPLSPSEAAESKKLNGGTIAQSIPLPIKGMLSQCWMEDPNARPTAKSLYKTLRDLVDCYIKAADDAPLTSLDDIKITFHNSSRQENTIGGERAEAKSLISKGDSNNSIDTKEDARRRSTFQQRRFQSLLFNKIQVSTQSLMSAIASAASGDELDEK